MSQAVEATEKHSAMPSFGLRRMTAIQAELDALNARLGEAEALLGTDAAKPLLSLRKTLDSLCPQITFVGQVKAGKTALVNALSGRPGLLPSDVNPWTSVVTSIQVNGQRPRNVRSEFTFFQRDEWEDLVKEGGRLGEMARRAGAHDELAEIRRQVNAMCEKSRARLGRNFELLLGQRHKYDHFDTALIERYVCLGDPEEDGADRQGRFADITRLAKLYIDEPAYPLPLLFQDTPGVNDPFLMREQITLKSVRGASLCVVVLSAAQALNAVDLALVQLLSSMENRRVIIFVNRIDELDRPETQVAEIRRSLTRTFDSQSLGGIGHIIFGCARWAEAALTGGLEQLRPDSRASLVRVVEAVGNADTPVNAQTAWIASGLPALQEAIGTIVEQTSARRVVEHVRRKLGNLVMGAANQALARCEAGEAPRSRLSPDELEARLHGLRLDTETQLAGASGDILARFDADIADITAAFIDQSLLALTDAFAQGVAGREKLDPMFLRTRTRVIYARAVRDARAMNDAVGQSASDALNAIYGALIGEDAGNLTVEPPQAPHMPPPVSLGRTILIDMQTPWWKSWLGRHRTPEALEQTYRPLIEIEVKGITDDVRACIETALEETTAAMALFLEEQGQIAAAIAERDAIQTASLAETRRLVAALRQLHGRIRGESDEALPPAGAKVMEFRNAV